MRGRTRTHCGGELRVCPRTHIAFPETRNVAAPVAVHEPEQADDAVDEASRHSPGCTTAPRTLQRCHHIASQELWSVRDVRRWITFEDGISSWRRRDVTAAHSKNFVVLHERSQRKRIFPPIMPGSPSCRPRCKAAPPGIVRILFCGQGAGHTSCLGSGTVPQSALPWTGSALTSERSSLGAIPDKKSVTGQAPENPPARPSTDRECRS